MKISKLKLKNITSLRGEHEINFLEIEKSTPLFAITGITGSGKSTILNSITMALYGDIPKKSVTAFDFVSLGEEVGSISLDFINQKGNFTVNWNARVRKKDGSLLKKIDLRREIYRNGVIITTPIDEIIGLSFDEFCRTIFLGQGEFSKFLLGTFAERKTILERLASGDILILLSRLLKERVKEHETKVNELKIKEESAPPFHEEDFFNFKKEVKEHTENLAIIRLELITFESVYNIFKDFIKLLQNRLSTIQKLKTLTEESQLVHPALLLKSKEIEALTNELNLNKAILEKNRPLVQEIKNLKIQNIQYQKELDAIEKHFESLSKSFANIDKEISLLSIENESLLKKHANRVAQDEDTLLEKSKESAKNIFEAMHLASEQIKKLQIEQEEDEKKLKRVQELTTKANLIADEIEQVTREIKARKRDRDQYQRNEAISLCQQILTETGICPVCENKNDLSHSHQHHVSPKPPTEEIIQDLLKNQKEKEITFAKVENEITLFKLKSDNDRHVVTEEINRLRNRLEELKEKRLETTKANEFHTQNLRELTQLLHTKEKLSILQKQKEEIATQTGSLLNHKATVTRENESILERLNLSLTKEVNEDQLLILEAKEKSINEKLEKGRNEQQILKGRVSYFEGQQSLQKTQIHEFDLLIATTFFKIKNLIDKSSTSILKSNVISEPFKGAITTFAQLDSYESCSLELTAALLNQLESEKENLAIKERELDTTKSSLDSKIEIYELKNLERLAIKKQLEQLLKESRPLMLLCDAIANKDDFRNFVLGMMERQLILLTNLELKKLCDGRYQLTQVEKAIGAEFYIIDAYQDGIKRKVATLSGGETFLVSLAMALSLAEIIRGSVDIDSFFIDEGFGTLDGDSLDDVLETLNSLSRRGKQIGVISHIKRLTDQIALNVHVEKSGPSSSRIEIRNN